MSLYYETNKRGMYDYKNPTLTIFTQTTTYVLILLMKRWRRTRARVERTMMVVHIVPRAQSTEPKRQQVQQEAAIVTSLTSADETCLFLSSSDCLARSATLGISQSQIRKDDMVHYQGRAQLHI